MKMNTIPSKLKFIAIASALTIGFLLSGSPSWNGEGAVLKADNQEMNLRLKKRIRQWKKDLADETLPPDAVKMQYRYAIPRENPKDPNPDDQDDFVFLRSGAFLCTDNQENIYVSDTRNHAVYKFNALGHFIKKFGIRGKGPGDLLGPKSIFTDRSKNLVVHDSGNWRVQVFNPKGVYMKSFRLFEAYNCLIVDDKNQSILCSFFGIDKPLIRVFDYDGNAVGAFGKRLTFENRVVGANKVFMSADPKGDIYVAWELFPLVRKYSREGKLLAEYSIHHPRIVNNANFNRASIAGSSPRRQFKIAIAGIRAKENGFYLFSFYPRIDILEYDAKGKQVRHFWSEQTYDYIGSDFMVKEGTNGIRTFYILKIFPENQVTLYTAKAPKPLHYSHINSQSIKKEKP